MSKYDLKQFLMVLMAGLLSMACSLSYAEEIRQPGNNLDDYKLFQQAVILGQQGDWSQAAERFNELAQRNPGWPEPKNNLAVALLQLGKVNQAQQALEAAVTSLPSFKTAQHNRKRLYDHMAAVAYDKAIGVTSDKKFPELVLLTEISQPKVELAKVDLARAELARAELARAEQTRATLAVLDATPQPVAEDNDTYKTLAESIKQQLLSWSRAWSLADAQGYFSAYSSQFKPAELTTSYTQWKQTRHSRLRLTKNTQVRLENIRVFLGDGNKLAMVEFIQHYQSANYKDKVIKQLLLTEEQDRWLIVSERVIQQLN